MRIVLVLLAPALVIGLLEGGLRLLNYGHPTSFWIESRDDGTYLSNQDFGIRFLGRALNRPVVASVLSRTKPENTYRIFVFGGSAAWGTPDEAFSFARVLEAMLIDRFTGTRFEVINTAMGAINSHVVYQIARDCRGLEGDLYIVYMGNNEVVGPYGPGTVFMGYNPTPSVIRMSASLRATRSGQVLADILGGRRGPKEWRGMAMFLENRVTAGDPRLEGTYESFRINLHDICREANRAGAKVILSTVITNLKDLSPFASVNRLGMPADERKRWDKLYAEGTRFHRDGRHAEALHRYGVAATIDDTFAELHFRMGSCFLTLEQLDRARAHFTRARDLDALRFRADSRINDIIREAATELRSHDVHLVDAARTVSGESAPGGIPGTELLYEHVHLRFEGNYELAAAMYRQVVPLLPPSVRGNTVAGADPPSLERCATLLVLTPYARFRNVERMLHITGRPPFREEHRARDLAAIETLRAQITPTLLADAARAYRERLKARPADLLLRRRYAALEAYRGRFESAAEQTALGLQRYPHDLFGPRHNLGNVLKSQGRFEEAVEQYTEALRLRPDHVEARCSLASVLAHLGRYNEAVTHYEGASRAQPGYVLARNGLAWMLATCPDAGVRDGQRAVGLARRLSEETGHKIPVILSTLAAAHAETGNYGDAARWQERAVQLAPSHLKDTFGQYLKLYMSGRPYRDIPKQ